MNLPEASQWVAVARLGRTWGNRGELAATSLSSKPERFQQLNEVFLYREGVPVGTGALRVERVWRHGEEWVFKFRGVDSISAAEALENAEVRIPREARAPLEKDEHYLSDLVGCEMRDRATGELVGIVTGWQDTGGVGLLEIGEGPGQLLVPFARSICVEIDTSARCIRVDLPEGLKDLNRS